LTAAVVLYLLTSANVRGFAFTLGLTTLVDLLVVTLFTHPMVQILARHPFFASGNKWSGFDLSASATNYVGRGQFRVSENLASGKKEKASKEAIKRQTIAERKALAGKENNNG
jgi:preprotein translocase subunit SecD